MQSYERLQPARQKADLDIDLTDDEWRFFEQRTGTTDRAAIGKHISRLQKTAYQNVSRQNTSIGDPLSSVRTDFPVPSNSQHHLCEIQTLQPPRLAHRPRTGNRGEVDPTGSWMLLCVPFVFANLIERC